MACPYAVLEVLVNQACLRGNEGAALSVCSNGDRATKAQLVADWRNLFGSTITGHSTRRSGALQYIRDGWSVSQVAFLGRWKSSVILEYAKEALQSIPLNADKKLFGNSELHQTSQTDEDKHEGRASFQPSNLELVGKLKTEIDSFMNGTKADTTELTTKVRQLETKFENYTKFLPPLVISNRASVVHRNNKVFLCSPSYMWRTQCGWNYYNSDYEFSEDLGMKVTCQKCSTSALQQRGKGADVLADTRTMPSIWDFNASGFCSQWMLAAPPTKTSVQLWGGSDGFTCHVSCMIVVNENGTFSEWQENATAGGPFWLKINPLQWRNDFNFHTHPPLTRDEERELMSWLTQGRCQAFETSMHQVSAANGCWLLHRPKRACSCGVGRMDSLATSVAWLSRGL